MSKKTKENPPEEADNGDDELDLSEEEGVEDLPEPEEESGDEPDEEVDDMSGGNARMDLVGISAEERKISELINTLAQHIRIAMKSGGVNLVTVAIVGNHAENGRVFEVTPKMEGDEGVRESMITAARLSSAMLLKGHLGRIVNSIQKILKGV